MSDRASDCPGPFLLPSVGAKHSGLGAAEVLASGLDGSGLLHDDTSGSPAPWGGEAGGVSLSIISGRRSPRRRTLLRRATSRTAKERFWLLFSEEEAIAFYSRLTYSSVEGWPVCGHGAVGTPSGAGPPGEVFFPCLGTSASKSSEAALFFQRGEGTLDSPPQLSSFMETVIPSVWMCNV